MKLRMQLITSAGKNSIAEGQKQLVTEANVSDVNNLVLSQKRLGIDFKYSDYPLGVCASACIPEAGSTRCEK